MTTLADVLRRRASVSEHDSEIILPAAALPQAFPLRHSSAPLPLAPDRFSGPRQLRHTFATLALVDGARIEWISKQLGHEDIATTLRRYHKWLPDDRRNVNTLNTAHAARTGLKTDSALQEAK